MSTTKLQMAMFPPKSEWLPPEHPFPDIFDAPEIAIDVETRDPNIQVNGPGWPTGDGEVVGYAIAVPDWSAYIPIRHLVVTDGIIEQKLKNLFMTGHLIVVTHSDMQFIVTREPALASIRDYEK